MISYTKYDVFSSLYLYFTQSLTKEQAMRELNITTTEYEQFLAKYNEEKKSWLHKSKNK